MSTSTDGLFDMEGVVDKAPVAFGALGVAAAMVVGAVSFLDGPTLGFERRLPIYALAGGLAFVAALLAMRSSPRDGRTVLRRGAATGFLGAVVVGLASEAVVYGLVLLAPGLSLYGAAVVVVGCGLGYWSVRNWHAVNDLTRPW